MKEIKVIEASIKNELSILKNLINENYDINERDERGLTSLHYAVAQGHSEVVKLLIENGAEIDSLDTNGNTPLNDAVFHSKGDPTIIRILLKAGADPNYKNFYGVSPEKLAETIANYNLAKYLK
ncbi:MAG: ankyrin repeat domain-containing protein [Desulfovibrionales bacterium]|nr:ankyrin repeat domain-containing protein [Desulfovibrionales bacterium]